MTAGCWEDAAFIADTMQQRAVADQAWAEQQALIAQVRAEFAEEDVALRIRQTRKAMGLSAEQFGALIGVTKTAVWNYESGYSKPLPRVMEKIDRLATALREQEVA